MEQIYIQLKTKRSIQRRDFEVVAIDYFTMNSSCSYTSEMLCKGPPGRMRSPGKAVAWAGQSAVFTTFEGELNQSSIEKSAERKRKPSMKQNYKAIKKTKINSSILNF